MDLLGPNLARQVYWPRLVLKTNPFNCTVQYSKTTTQDLASSLCGMNPAGLSSQRKQRWNNRYWFHGHRSWGAWH